MHRIAHRGCAGQYPENTLAAFRAAAPHVDAVELDVRRCGSGELVVIHDARVDRVTDGTGAVRDHSLADLQALDVLDSGESVPTLAAVFDAVPDSVGVNAELKESGLAGDVAEMANDVPHEVLVSSFDPGVLADVASHDPTLPTALLFSGNPDENVARASALGCAAVHPVVEVCLHSDVVDRAHEAEMVVNAWTVADADTAAALAGAGVDGIITDRWDIT
ncbi:glycerophosphodiester phosphodiesterase [Halobacteriaceae archaeon GCM10025711]